MNTETFLLSNFYTENVHQKKEMNTQLLLQNLSKAAVYVFRSKIWVKEMPDRSQTR